MRHFHVTAMFTIVFSANLFAKSEFPSAGFAIDVSNVDKLRKIQSHLNKYLLSSSLNYFFSGRLLILNS